MLLIAIILLSLLLQKLPHSFLASLSKGREFRDPGVRQGK